VTCHGNSPGPSPVCASGRTTKARGAAGGPLAGRLCDAEKRRACDRARSAPRHQTRRACLSAAPTGRGASCATGPWVRASEGSRRAASTTASKRCRLPGCALAGPMELLDESSLAPPSVCASGRTTNARRPAAHPQPHSDARTPGTTSLDERPLCAVHSQLPPLVQAPGHGAWLMPCVRRPSRRPSRSARIPQKGDIGSPKGWLGLRDAALHTVSVLSSPLHGEGGPEGRLEARGGHLKCPPR